MTSQMNTPSRIARALIVVAASTLVGARAEASSLSTYISLGDSIAYGSGSTQDAAPGSVGSTGFVSQFAGTLGQANGGTVPNVINLALPNETLGSFLSGNSDSAANSNYGSSHATQFSEFLQTVTSQAAAGQGIGTVTIALGTSDIANILNSPGFASLSLVQQATALQSGLALIQAEYAGVLAGVRTLLPNAQIDLIGAYNPYHATPNSPLAPIAEPAFLGLNNIIQGEASQFGATYINTYTAFLGHEGTYTNILGGQGNIEPTAAGDSAIAALLAPSAVPEPSTLFLAGFGLIGLAGHAMRRRREARIA